MLEKWSFLDQKHGLTLFGKMTIFPLLELLVFTAEDGVFFLLEYRKRDFLGLYCQKRNFEKNGHFSTF